MTTKTQQILSTSSFFRNLLLAALPLLILSGCSEPETPATQIVAKVNNDEITVHQVNAAMSKVPNVTAENADEVRQEILTKLINQQLAVQKARDVRRRICWLQHRWAQANRQPAGLSRRA